MPNIDWKSFALGVAAVYAFKYVSASMAAKNAG
jgi:hypothetical protein